MPWGAPSFVSLPNKKQHQLKTTTKKTTQIHIPATSFQELPSFFFSLFRKPQQKTTTKNGWEIPPFWVRVPPLRFQ